MDVADENESDDKPLKAVVEVIKRLIAIAAALNLFAKLLKTLHWSVASAHIGTFPLFVGLRPLDQELQPSIRQGQVRDIQAHQLGTP